MPGRPWGGLAFALREVGNRSRVRAEETCFERTTALSTGDWRGESRSRETCPEAPGIAQARDAGPWDQ